MSEDKGDVAVVAVCRECGGWVAVMTEEMERRGGDGYREIMGTVGKLDLRIIRIPGDDFRSGKVGACHRYRKAKTSPRLAHQAALALALDDGAPHEQPRSES